MGATAMMQERSGHSSVLLNNSIFVADGQNMAKKKESFLDMMERFDLETEQWYQCKPMTEERSLFSLVCVDNHIKIVEVYSAIEDKWSRVDVMATECAGGIIFTLQINFRKRRKIDK